MTCSAIADLIDNSIKANAKIVRVLAQFNEGHPVIKLLMMATEYR